MRTGNYKSEKSLIQELKTEIDKKVVEKNSDGSLKEIFRITQNNDNSLKIEILNDRYAFQFTDDLAYTLGFKKNVWYETVENNALQPIDLHYNLNTIYVYSDLAANSIVSNTKGPLLAILPVKTSSKDRTIHHHFPAHSYFPVVKSVFDEITISMTGDFGREIPFVEGIETTMELHFRVYKE